MRLKDYFKIWAACIRYSLQRAMIFRFDFILWFIVDIAWMCVSVLLVEVVYGHIDNLVGWTKYEMLLLVGTALLISRIFSLFFMVNLFELSKKVREGELDFTLVQPGNPLFMISTRKIELDGFFNIIIASGIVIYASHQLHLEPNILQIILYSLSVCFGVCIHYSLTLAIVSLSFWITSTEGVENGYFSFAQFGRLPINSYTGIKRIFVYVIPIVLASNIPAMTLIHGVKWQAILTLALASSLFFIFAYTLFSKGLQQYTSASS